MTNYGTIPTSSSEGPNEPISTATPQVKLGIHIGRPWKEMLRSLNLPSGFRGTVQRIKINLSYFRTKYMIIFMLIFFLSTLFHPVSSSIFLAFLIIALVALNISNRMIVICLLLFSVSFLFTEAAWNIISSLFIEAVVVTAHASLRKTDDLSLDEEVALAAGIPNARARPWKEMIRSLNLPSGFRNTIQRMKTNINYFEINYVIILLPILCLSFLWHPISLALSMNLCADVWLLLYYLYTKPSSALQGSCIFVAIVLMIISLIALSFIEAAWINILSTLLIEALVVAAHASVRKTDDLYSVLDEELAQTADVLTSSSS